MEVELVGGGPLDGDRREISELRHEPGNIYFFQTPGWTHGYEYIDRPDKLEYRDSWRSTSPVIPRPARYEA